MCASVSGNSRNSGLKGKPAGNREWQPEIGDSRGFCFKQRHSLCTARETRRVREGERGGRGLLANQTHLKTVPSGPRHELSAMVKFMRRMQQQYVQQQRQQQRLYNKTKALQTQPSPVSPHAIQKAKRTSKAGSGAAFYRTFLRNTVWKITLWATRTRRRQERHLPGSSYSHGHCLRAQRMPNV